MFSVLGQHPTYYYIIYYIILYYYEIYQEMFGLFLTFNNLVTENLYIESKNI